MAIQISPEQSFAYAELLEILSFTDIHLVNKIPNKLIHIFQKYASTSYENHLDNSIPLEHQHISKKTATLIAILTLNYWCDSEEEKDKLKSILNENAKILEQEQKEKFNPDNIFKNNDYQKTAIQTEIIEEASNLPLDYSSIPWYKKIFISFKNYLYNLLKK